MKAEDRTKNIMTLLGWDGGTVHDACKEIGCDVHEFLYSDSDFDDSGRPCESFMNGYKQAGEIANYKKDRKGDLQYWFGAISAVQNGYDHPNFCQ